MVTLFSEEKIRELYPTRDGYMRRVIESALKMVSDGYLLAEDAPALIFDALANYD